MLKESVFKTSDMALATLLRCQGLPYSLRLVRPGRASWDFEVDDYQKIVDWQLQYDAGTLRVEPRVFVREFTKTRTELYRFLGRRQPDATPSTAPA